MGVIGSGEELAVSLALWETMRLTPSSRPSPPLGEKVPEGRLRGPAARFWSAPVLWRFWSVGAIGSPHKAPEHWRSPGRWRDNFATICWDPGIGVAPAASR